MDRAKILRKMQQDWDARALENARYYVATGSTNWNDADFYASGELAVAEDVLGDITTICQGRDPKQMRVLEIGCGAGRITRALSGIFGEVHAVDVSGEMIRLAGAALADRPNVHLYQNNGEDLTIIPPGMCFDFAYSTIVFQHIPSPEVIESYVRETGRLLRKGALFKFQVQGDPRSPADPDPDPEDTWVGAFFTEQQAIEMAYRCGFEPRYRHGAGEQYFWLWFFKS